MFLEERVRGGRRARLLGVLAGWLLLGGLLAPVAPAGAATDGWEQFDARLAAVAPRVGFLAAEVVDGRCETVHGYQAGRRLAIASTFKLYVLAELARQVQAGEAAWDEPIAIDDGLRSMPSGDTVFERTGTRHTLAELARRMIAASDNTATDHLIARLGRERIEADLARFGHDEPELNMPLLLTRELFALKMYADPSAVEAFLDATDEEQRRFLADVVGPQRLDPSNWGHWVEPSWIDRLEWFASPREVCRVLAALHEMSRQPGLEPLRGILAGNRGPLFAGKAWPWAGFKGGYEAGVSNSTWIIERADGRTFVVTAGFNDTDAYVNLGAASQALAPVPALLARAP